MATSLKDYSHKLPRKLICVLACILCFSSAAAEQFNDPTRPAIELVPGLAATAAPAAPQLGLQSVIISSKREAAIINGAEIEVGQKFGDSVLTMVNETCVVLMGPQGRQVMHMFPTVSMSKNELACDKRPAMQPVRKVASAQAKKSKTKKARAKKHAITCVADDIKNGSGK